MTKLAGQRASLLLTSRAAGFPPGGSFCIVLGADDLLVGPRGRGSCLAVAHQLDQLVWSAWLHAAWEPSPARRGDLVRALHAVDAGAVMAWRDPIAFVEAVDQTVSHAMYWQPPDEQDVAAADPDVVEALRPIAAAVASAPAAAWWSSPLDLHGLRYVSWIDGQDASTPVLAGAAERLQRWREQTLEDDRDAALNRPADPVAPFSGRWWSTPAMASLVTTTRAIPGLGAVELAWREDSPGQREALIWPLMAIRSARVWEIDRPDAWTRLVDQYPLDVSTARRHDWYQTTGRAGSWHIPDWRAVADDWDAVHLSVAGYLTTATRALPLAAEDAATVLAGWNPDQTWWLTDVLATTSGPQRWHNDPNAGGSVTGWRSAPE